jgi:hypothetical protein
MQAIVRLISFLSLHRVFFFFFFFFFCNKCKFLKYIILDINLPEEYFLFYIYIYIYIFPNANI